MGVTAGSVIGAVTGDVALWVALGPPIGGGVGLSIAIVYAVMNQPPPTGVCLACAYSTKGLISRVCPECGADLDAQRARLRAEADASAASDFPERRTADGEA